MKCRNEDTAAFAYRESRFGKTTYIRDGRIFNTYMYISEWGVGGPHGIPRPPARSDPGCTGTKSWCSCLSPPGGSRRAGRDPPLPMWEQLATCFHIGEGGSRPPRPTRGQTPAATHPRRDRHPRRDPPSATDPPAATNPLVGRDPPPATHPSATPPHSYRQMPGVR